MKKSIKKIIIQLIVILAILVLPLIIVDFENRSGNSIQNKEVIIKIMKDNIEIEEEFDLEISAKTTAINLKAIIGTSWYENSIRGLEIDHQEVIQNWNYAIRNTEGKNTTKHIKVNYLLQEDYIKKYIDLSCLTLNLCSYNLDYAKNINIMVQFEEPTQIFEVENRGIFGNVTTNKISDTEYKFHINKARGLSNQYISVLFDNTLTNIGEIQNESYRTQEDIGRQEFIEESHYLPILFMSGILLIICCILYFMIIGRKQKVYEVRREWEGLVSPVLAETIIDGKVGIKELIMTVVIDLVTRGNIEVINNESIRLLHTDNLEKYEEKIVFLLFEEKKQIYFSDLKDIFIKINSKTKEMYEDIEEIKNSIIAELTEKGILSNKKKDIMNILRGILEINIFIIILTVSGLIASIETAFYLIIIVISIVIIFASKKRNFFEKMDRINNTRDSMKLKMTMIMFGILIVVGILWNMNKAPIGNLLFVGIIILDIIFIIKTKKQFLTQKGKEERRKILELKKYLEEYSIMEERDLQDVILWDKYLAYATALGIPNNVTKKVYEDYMNVNIALQMIEKIIKII